MMEIDETIHVPADPDTVWALLSDPYAVVECVSGATLGEQRDDGSYDARLMVKFGPVKVAFAARVAIEMDAHARSGTVASRGKDQQGGTRFAASTTFRVEPQAAGDAALGGSRILVHSAVEITGRLASLIESGASLVVKRMTRDFAEQLTIRCTGIATADVDAAGTTSRGD